MYLHVVLWNADPLTVIHGGHPRKIEQNKTKAMERQGEKVMRTGRVTEQTCAHARSAVLLRNAFGRRFRWSETRPTDARRYRLLLLSSTVIQSSALFCNFSFRWTETWGNEDDQGMLTKFERTSYIHIQIFETIQYNQVTAVLKCWKWNNCVHWMAEMSAILLFNVLSKLWILKNVLGTFPHPQINIQTLNFHI